jgi:hypothetical protein
MKQEEASIYSLSSPFFRHIKPKHSD